MKNYFFNRPRCLKTSKKIFEFWRNVWKYFGSFEPPYFITTAQSINLQCNSSQVWKRVITTGPLILVSSSPSGIDRSVWEVMRSLHRSEMRGTQDASPTVRRWRLDDVGNEPVTKLPLHEYNYIGLFQLLFLFTTSTAKSEYLLTTLGQTAYYYIVVTWFDYIVVLTKS